MRIKVVLIGFYFGICVSLEEIIGTVDLLSVRKVLLAIGIVEKTVPFVNNLFSIFFLLESSNSWFNLGHLLVVSCFPLLKIVRAIIVLS